MGQEIADVPRGNTCPGVNRSILKYLALQDIDLDGKAVLDIPCGDGEFLNSLRKFFPNIHTVGADIIFPAGFTHEFCQLDARQSETIVMDETFDLVTCISGVMEFDNTLGFFRSLNRLANNDAVFIVTNDNVATVRDRVLYFLFGRFGQYKTIPEKRGTTWKILHLADLERILIEAGLKVKEVHYVVGNWTAWLWLPVAVPIYAVQMTYFLLAERSITFSNKMRFFPFVSTIARHYLLVCEKDGKVEDVVTGRFSGNK